MIDWLQVALSALSLGASYALVALGFVLVLNATRAVNFAQGDLVVAGGFLAVALAPAIPVPGVLLVPVVLAAMAVLGLAIAGAAYLPLRNRPPTAVFLSTIAVGIILQNAVLRLAGPEPKRGPALVEAPAIEIAGSVLSVQSATAILVAAVLITLLHLFLSATQAGRRMRAAAQDPETARALGIRVLPYVLSSFALAAALAGAAGMLVANQFFLTPADGGAFMLKAYIAVVIGGWGRIWGAVLGALLIAVFETVVATLVSHLIAEALLYAGLLLILLLRPQGLLGEAEGRRA